MPNPAYPLCLLFVAAGWLALSPALGDEIRLPPNSSVPRRGDEMVPLRRAAYEVSAARSSFRNLDMRPRVVRDGKPGCGDGCAEWIAAEGRIAPGTADLFAGVLRELGGRRLPVLIDSGGGSVEDALRMGRMLRERRLDVAVAETIPDCAGCEPDAALPRSPGAVCASACVLVLAAGSGRVGGLATHVGVHQMTVKGVRWVLDGKSGAAVSVVTVAGPASQETNDRVARYLGDMGIGAGLMPMMLSAPPNRIRWLTPREEQSANLLTATTGGEALLASSVSSRR